MTALGFGWMHSLPLLNCPESCTEAVGSLPSCGWDGWGESYVVAAVLPAIFSALTLSYFCAPANVSRWCVSYRLLTVPVVHILNVHSTHDGSKQPTTFTGTLVEQLQCTIDKLGHTCAQLLKAMNGQRGLVPSHVLLVSKNQSSS
jgi:hypothetical protein